MRLIDADELKRYIDIFNVACGCNDNHQEEILEAIDDQPTVELSEVQKTGHWIQKRDEYGDYYVCSVCGEELPRVSTAPCTVSNPYPEMISIDKTDFCPNCGENMGENR